MNKEVVVDEVERVINLNLKISIIRNNKRYEKDAEGKRAIYDENMGQVSP